MATKQEPQVESVKMTDGRIVDFPGKRKLDKTSYIEADGSVAVRLDFRNGETRLFNVPAMLLTKFAAHGAEQKLGDEIAGVEDVDDCTIAVDELIDRLNNGEWGVKREASGISGTSVLLRAIVEVTGKAIDKVKEYLKAKTQAEKLALRESPRFRDAVKRLESEKESKRQKIDVAPLEAELDNI
jgi:hypothetical protein